MAYRMGWRGWALAVLLALTVGCGGSRERALGDCEYAETVRTAFQGFSHSLTAAGLQLSIAGPAATAEQRAAAARALDELNVELGRLLDDLRRLRVGGDLQRVNAALVATFEDIRRQLPALKQAALAGDSERVDEVLERISRDAEARLERLNREQPQVASRLEACR